MYEPIPELRPGTTATVVADDLLVRAAPGTVTAAVGQLRAGDRVTLTASPVAGDGQTWWPIRVDDDGSSIAGYVAAEWLEPVAPPTPLERLQEVVPNLD